MRKRYRILIFMALVAALAVPLGYALSLESAPIVKRARYGVAAPMAAAAVVAPAAVRRDRLPAPTDYPVPDAAKLLGVGTVLFGLAAALRKSSER